MNEILPFMAGCLLGLFALRLKSPTWQVCVTGALGVALGVMASAINGELAVSPLFALVDIALVLGPALVTLVTVRRLRRRQKEVGLP